MDKKNVGVFQILNLVSVKLLNSAKFIVIVELIDYVKDQSKPWFLLVKSFVK